MIRQGSSDPEAPVAVWLSLGANVPEAHAKVAQAVEHVRRLLSRVKVAEPYVTEPVSGIGPRYVNTVAFGFTSLSEPELNSRCKGIELLLGRTGESRVAGRVEADIDVVVYDGCVLRPADFERDYFSRGYRLMS